jgi:hypothetical protein
MAKLIFKLVVSLIMVIALIPSVSKKESLTVLAKGSLSLGMRAAKLQIQLRREGLCHWALWFEWRLRMSGTPSGLNGRILNKQIAPGRAASMVVLPGAKLCHFTYYLL